MEAHDLHTVSQAMFESCNTTEEEGGIEGLFVVNLRHQMKTHWLLLALKPGKCKDQD